MRRDAELMRTILLKVEASNSPIAASKMDIPGCSGKELFEQARLAKENGFIEAILSSDQTNFVVNRLTAAGHEFLGARVDATISYPKPTLSEYLRLIVSDWTSLVSGGLSVPFTYLSLVAGNKYTKVIYAMLAIFGILFASYRLWADERRRQISIEQEDLSQYREALRRYRTGEQPDQPTTRRLRDAGFIDAVRTNSMDSGVEPEYLPTGITDSGMRVLDSGSDKPGIRVPKADVG